MGYLIRVEPDVKIYVEDVNRLSQKVILFIHGWPASHKLFEYQFNVLPELGYRCIGIDIRGFGKSDKPYSGYSYNRLADDIRCVIDTLGLHHFTLAGHSVGGAIATRYMGRHQGYGVSRLALFGAAAPSFTKKPGFPYGLNIEDVNQLIQETYEDRPKMLSELTEQFFYKKPSDPLAHWFFHLGLEAAGYSTAGLLRSLRDEILFYDLPYIQVPTLLLHGVHDKISLPPLGSILHQSIPGSRLVWFEESGHGLFWEEKEKFNRELVEFIR